MTAMPTTQAVRRPQAHGYQAALDELLLRLAVAPDRPLVVETAEMQQQRVQTEANPEDMQPPFGDVHSQSEFTGGEGLIDRFRRRATDADATRFWMSEGVNVAPTEEGRPESARLLKSTSRIDEISGAPVRLAATADTLWATSGQTIRKTADPLAPSPTFADDDPHDGETATDVEDLSTLGDTIYAALGDNGIHRDEGSGWEHWSDVEAVRVWAARDRILASTGRELYEASQANSSVLLYTLPEGERWTDVADAGQQLVLAAASNGFVYSFSLGEEAELEIVGQTLLKDESPVAVTGRGDQVWIAATQGEELRLWSGRVEGPGVVDLQLIREWHACGCGELLATRDRVLMGVADPDGRAFVWRYELVTGGIFKANELGEGRPHGLATIEGRIFAAADDDGVWRESEDTHVNEGYLIGPMSDFFRSDRKSWVSGWLDVDIGLGGSVELYYTTDRAAMHDPDHPSWARLRTYGSSSRGQEIPLRRGTVARSLAGMVKVSRNSDGTSPRVQAMAFRAYPGPGDVIVQLPVDVGDQVERFGRRRTMVPGWGLRVVEALREREGRAATVRVFRTNETVRGVVERVATPSPAFTPRGSATQVCMVTVRGRRVDDEDAFDIAGWGALGMGQWGAVAFGGELVEDDDA